MSLVPVRGGVATELEVPDTDSFFPLPSGKWLCGATAVETIAHAGGGRQRQLICRDGTAGLSELVSCTGIPASVSTTLRVWDSSAEDEGVVIQLRCERSGSPLRGGHYDY